MHPDSQDLTQAREAERTVRDSYDRVPYPSSSQHRTHPDHLAVLALLHGLEPAPPGRCRVLELGCADGGNLLPMAIEMPESGFVGVDLSPRQIEAGQAFAAELNVANLELRAGSILDMDASWGRFDYILCHGVFSWVSPAVQERILAVCRENLAPGGVAYVSYNTFPGWHLRRMVRDMALYHTRGVDAPEERAERTMELVRFLAESVWGEEDAHAIFLRSVREHFEEYRDRPSYLLHEYLEETNAPVYFHEFVALAARHGLQYLSEADPHLMEIGNLPAQVAERLRGFASERIELEQYMDFVLNRTFRRTLLCHAEVPLDRTVGTERMRRLHAASGVRPDSTAPDLRSGIGEGFRAERGTSFSTSHPLAKAVLVTLAGVWPRALAFDDLLMEARERLGAAGEGEGGSEEVLADLLDSLYWSGIVELHLLPPVCTETVSAFPRAAPLARRQAAAGVLVTNQRRRVLKLDDPVARVLLLHLDGSRDRAALVSLLERDVREGRLDIAFEGEPLRDSERLPAVLTSLVEHHLRKLAEHALLLG
jgi:methyltransferase-like protein/cyclopropane fatty-acyl-phospholipid synthase-like methyltransferase